MKTLRQWMGESLLVLRPLPAERLAAMRILVGLFALIYLISRHRYLLSPATMPAQAFEPVGLGLWLQGPLSAPALYLAYAFSLLSALAFVGGWYFAWSAPLFALSLLWITTYRSCWSMVFHTENLMVLHVGVLALAPAAHAWSLDAKRRATPAPAHPRYAWPLRLMALIVVLSYLIPGVAKLRHSGLNWLNPQWLRYWVAYDNLRKIALGHIASPLGIALVPHRWLFTPLSFGAIALELGAPLVLLGRRVAAFWVVGILVFHWLVLIFMVVAFPYALTGIPFAMFFPVERWLYRVSKWSSRRRAPEGFAQPRTQP